MREKMRWFALSEDLFGMNPFGQSSYVSLGKTSCVSFDNMAMTYGPKEIKISMCRLLSIVHLYPSNTTARSHIQHIYHIISLYIHVHSCPL